MQDNKNLSVTPGSPRVPPTKDVTSDRLLVGDFNDVIHPELKWERPEVPSAALIYLNASTFHTEEAKPFDIAQ